MGWPLDVHYSADLQSVRGFRCYDNIAPNAKCQRVLVFALCLVISSLLGLILRLYLSFLLTEALFKSHASIFHVFTKD